ncbi:MAG: hypothetical protein ABWX65_01320 [Mycetocola sp.]
MDVAKSMRRMRAIAVSACWSGVVIIGGSVAFMVAEGSFWPYAMGVVLGSLNLANGIVILRGLTLLRKNGSWTT